MLRALNGAKLADDVRDKDLYALQRFYVLKILIMACEVEVDVALFPAYASEVRSFCSIK